ncbi:MAG: cyclic beta 1-2 glucan synthetase [Alphaproteobacteria bacterium]|nr:cyclic beta 1-2 glucan synthetase [Alphaproteobacteria bacterium]
MRVSSYLSLVKSWFKEKPWPKISTGEALPLRAELFNAGQMEQHGKALAALHKLAEMNAPDQLLERLADNEAALIDVCKMMAAVANENRQVTPAGEWLLDNFYLIEEQIRTARRHLPRGYSLELPRLAKGPSEGQPRVYDIALEIIAHGDGRVDTEILTRFVGAYQSVASLKLGELWAIPIMLRLAIIENLRRVSVWIGAGWLERDLAATWSEQMIEAAETDPTSLILVIADMARSEPPMASAFVAELARRLQGRGPALALPLTWIEQRLSDLGLTIEQLVQLENQQQAANQVSISNCIGSMRILDAVDWKKFVETMSGVEQALLQDPCGTYGGMDFATRDRYRHKVEAIAKASGMAEIGVALTALALAKRRSKFEAINASVNSAAHVGYYLIGHGLPLLEQEISLRLSGLKRLYRYAAKFPLFWYLGGILLSTFLLSASLLTLARAGGQAVWTLPLLGILATLATSQLGVALINWLAIVIVRPLLLPRMDFSEGIPPEFRTLVVIPTMLTNAEGVDRLLEALEVRFLANRDDSLHFGLLTDFQDAEQESLAEDEPLLQLAQAGIDALNRKYGYARDSSLGSIFFLFHRPRTWNPQEQAWMGFERKRGKLADLNGLLRGANHRYRFSLIVGDTTALLSAKYVITLDTDTELPRDSAQQFVAAMAHPLNRPHYSEAKHRVTSGYGILQPRVEVSLTGANRSRYARLYGGNPGIDPYTRTVSNVYQDIFSEGSFIGKGIYDIDAFEQALGGQFPDNHVLSHDLLEGCYARSGLLSDLHLYEDCPSSYRSDVGRRHRWIRGDWQLAGWLFSQVPGMEKSERHTNPLSMLSQWKLIDNLRRSLVPSALTILLIWGWIGPMPTFLWTMSVLGVLLVPPICSIFIDILRKPAEMQFRLHLGSVAHSAHKRMTQILLELAWLPHEAFFTLDAIIRTGIRVQITRKCLLEWQTASEMDLKHASCGQGTLVASYLAMWFAPVLATIMAIYLWLWSTQTLAVAAPILFLWLVSPVAAWWISLPLSKRKSSLTTDQIIFLRNLARRTWGFFDQLVGPQDNWLPPDNFQEYRVSSVAHRTSPTNIGLSLLSNLAAYDFGYIPSGILLTRTASTFGSMEKLERHRGHFYNWYDTETLLPLMPQYVSTVDSGNLAGHLLTLRAGLLAHVDDPLFGIGLFEGMRDTLRLLADVAGKATLGEIANLQSDLEVAISCSQGNIIANHVCVERLLAKAESLVNNLKHSSTNLHGGTMTWAVAFAAQIRNVLDEMTFLAPWLTLQPHQPGLDEMSGIGDNLTLRELAGLDAKLLPVIEHRLQADITQADREWLALLQMHVKHASLRAREKISATERLARQAGEFASMEYDFLLDHTRHLLAIGYNVSERRQDASYYDLLASEARLSAFVAIAQGQMPQEGWFALGRLLTSAGREPVLMSWSGSMFEYLMPLLVMPTYENTLIDQTCKAAVACQIEYGEQLGVPWGISESGYNMVDVNLNYRYRAFGVPGLGLKRGLAEDLVVAPYASALALMVAPEEACRNLQRLAQDGYMGEFGFFEAIDFTLARQRRGQTSAVVQAYMAHHQGMILLALDYLLKDRPMQRRFEADRLFQTVMLLLQERIPKISAEAAYISQSFESRAPQANTEAPIRVFTNPDTLTPEVQLLTNGRYQVMVTNAGGGYSRWKDLAVTRWREDGICDNWGSFCYIRDLISDKVWSTSYQPTLVRPETYEAIFSESRIEFRRRDSFGTGKGSIETHTEIVVSPEDDIELRRIRVTNRSQSRRIIDVTSYAEVLIAPQAADSLHPAFSNLFVQTEILRSQNAILCSRRPRSHAEEPPWMFHLMVIRGAKAGVVSFETDRLRFIGRTNSVEAPQAVGNNAPLSDSEGPVLDPIVAIRQRITIDPEQSVMIDVVTGIGETREGALSLVEKYQDSHLSDRVFDLTWTHSQVTLRQLNATEASAQLYSRLASSIIYATPALRASGDILMKNRRGQSGLWGYGISGDLPIVLLKIADEANIDLVRQMVQAHAYWRLKGLSVDLVIWNEDRAGYRQRLQEQILSLIASGTGASVIDRPGGIFLRLAEQISSDDRVLFQSVARAIIADSLGSLAEQLDRRSLVSPPAPRLIPSRQHQAELSPSAKHVRSDLILSNELGGFTADGHEYVISLAPGQVTPLPWVNVLANPHFGTVVSESGSAYSWSENAHEFRLTPWHNDPVCDPGGEAIYLRDEETGHFWSPTPLPSPAMANYTVRHGFGYSVFECRSDGICTELWIYVASDAAVKFSRLKVRNESGRIRKLSATGYAEWVLGDLRSKSAMHVTTEIDRDSGAILAKNTYSAEFKDQVAFFDVDKPTRNLTGDRKEFIGRNGSFRNPAVMSRMRLSGKFGAGLDPCAAIQVNFDLADGHEHDIVFRLGVGRTEDEAKQLIQRFRGTFAARAALEAVWLYWNRTLGAVQVETPDASVNVLANGWLLYQTLSCRLWARSGYYQSGGAFGFRDQLQDVMALIHTEPALVREHLILCASRQFQEGDVQHWWHPPSGRGVRTHCSDDYLWLPYVVCHYVSSVGDTGVLDESIPFLEGRQVNLEDDSYYDLPGRSADQASLYEHCVRAIRHGLRLGPHGLPLMGSGDWNDGMNLVGLQGKGESVWLGFFLCDVLSKFATLARAREDVVFAELCQVEGARLRQNIEQHGWDGAWYRRAYFDDGTPLGSSDNQECRIDSISQSWSVLSGAGDATRARMAMQSADERLVRGDVSLIKLLDPPFDASGLNPGYIRGYVPGVRENGGQYTHGAIWMAMAYAALGDAKRAWELTSMINPTNHGLSAQAIATYKVEPYVMAADVYAASPHIGRGGWSWYTGSAGWMYRLVVESLLGLRLEGDKLSLKPCLPATWPSIKIHYRYRETVYHISMSQPCSDDETESLATCFEVDGVRQQDNSIHLVDDHLEHDVKVT